MELVSRRTGFFGSPLRTVGNETREELNQHDTSVEERIIITAAQPNIKRATLMIVTHELYQARGRPEGALVGIRLRGDAN